MFMKELIKRIRKVLGIWPGYSRRNMDNGGGETASGIKDIDYQRLETIFKPLSEKYKATGMTVAVVRNGGVEWTTSLGCADREAGIAAGPDTVYRVASISKTVTSMIVMTLWDKGIVELDRDISGYLGFTVRNPCYPEIPVTLEHLMTHTSSISDKGTYLEAVESGKGYPPLADMLTPGSPSYSAKNFYKYEPGSLNYNASAENFSVVEKFSYLRAFQRGGGYLPPRYNYSNFGFGIIAAIVESVTGKRFSDYAGEAIFNPLNLDASFLPNHISDPERVANIYRDGVLSFSKATAFSGEERISRFPIGQLYLLAQGNLYISAVDLARLMIVLMEGGTCEGRRILSREAVDMINKVRTVSQRGNKMVGLGLQVTDNLVAGRRLRGHQGRAYGATNEMFYDITDKTGVVYLSNGSKYKKALNGFAAIGSRIINAVYDEME